MQIIFQNPDSGVLVTLLSDGYLLYSNRRTSKAVRSKRQYADLAAAKKAFDEDGARLFAFVGSDEGRLKNLSHRPTEIRSRVAANGGYDPSDGDIPNERVH
jgi:hypothetical protein